VLTIVFTVFQLLASLVMLRRIYEYSYWDYCKKVVLPCLLFVVLNAVVPLLVYHLMYPSEMRWERWQGLIAVCASEVVVGSLLAYAIVLGKTEREMVNQRLRRLCRRI
jgi:hypothetical protein